MKFPRLLVASFARAELVLASAMELYDLLAAARSGSFAGVPPAAFTAESLTVGALPAPSVTAGLAAVAKVGWAGSTVRGSTVLVAGLSLASPAKLYRQSLPNGI